MIALIALEVTSTTVGEVHALWDAVGRQSWECAKCSWGWAIFVEAAGPGDKGAPIGEISRWIEDHLVVLEQADINYFGLPHPLPTDLAAANAVTALAKLRVRAGSSVGPPPHQDIAPQILVGTSGPGGIADPKHINTAAEKAIDDNIEKLRSAPVDERHLFLWVDSTDSDCFAPLSFGTLPTTPPTMAESLDKVWVAADLRGPTVPTSVLWSVTPTGPWVSETIRYKEISPDLGL